MPAVVPDDKKATEHLANERTFLAWVRTGIAVMSLGFVVAKFGLWMREIAVRLAPSATATPVSGASEPIGTAMIGVGGLLTVLAAWRFRVVNRQIEAGLVKVDHGLVVLITTTVAALALVLAAYLGLNARAAP